MLQLPTTSYLLPPTSYLLPTTYYLPLTTYNWLLRAAPHQVGGLGTCLLLLALLNAAGLSVLLLTGHLLPPAEV